MSHTRILKRALAAAWYAGARVVAAALKIEATQLNDARPGIQIRSTRPLQLWYYDGSINLPEGTDLTIEGWHNPTGDEMLGYQDLDLPDPQAGNGSVNLRVRTKDADGNELLLTTQELAEAFETVEAGKERLLDETLEMPGEAIPVQDEVATPGMRSISPEQSGARTNVMRAPGQAPAPRGLSMPLAPGETGEEPTSIRPAPKPQQQTVPGRAAR